MKELGEVQRIVQALGETVTAVSWSPRVVLCGLVRQPTAAALASVFMIHPMTFSPSL